MARFETVCFDCPTWDECSGCTIENGDVTPTCEVPLEHTSADKNGLTLETLNIDEGYWRATIESVIILACFNVDACRGGETGVDLFCAAGYQGPCERNVEEVCTSLLLMCLERCESPSSPLHVSYPYPGYRVRLPMSTFADCAVCETDFSPSLAHTCTQCSSSRRQGLVAATIIAAFVAVFAVATTIKFLLSTEHGEGNVGCFRRRVLQAVPVQALKIIVVVWQILTQV